MSDNKPLIIIVGADKGGVGKTLTARCVLDYLRSIAVEHRAFDTETETPGNTGVLKRFFPERTEIVDLMDSDGQMQVFDTLGSAVTVIDIRAGLLSPILKTLAEIGFLNPAKCRIVVMHVLGNNSASMDEVKSITESIATSRYIQIGNRINNTKFSFPAGALEISPLAPRAAEAVDVAHLSFSEFIKRDESPTLSGTVNFWLGKVFAQFETLRLTAQ
jgi:hypothetical protein